jgi:ABC-type nitrate/sulfonate/bicarbonate transport system permease component
MSAIRRVASLLARTRISGLLLIVALLILWELSVRLKLVQAVSWPAFSSVATAWVRLTLNGELSGELLVTLQRLFTGYGLAVVAGVGVGILMGYFRFCYNLLEPLSESLRPIPSPAYLPMAILFLGIGDQMKVFMVGLSCFFPILLNTYSGVRAVDPVQINTARTFGLGPWATIVQVIVPAAAPYIFTGMRISLAVALIVSVIAEMVASSNGMGFFILQTQRSFRIPEMYAGVIMLGLLGYLLNRAFLVVEARAVAWHARSMAREGV